MTISLAPLQGLTTPDFRRVFFAVFGGRGSGYDRAYAPFIKAVEEPFSARHFRELRDWPSRDGPSRDGPSRDGPSRDGPSRDGPSRDGPSADYELVPQLLCREPKAIVDSARRLAGLGFRELNLNMGCPFPMVAGKRRGSGILQHPDLIDRLLGESLPAIPIPVSIKLRLGRAHPDEMRPVLEVLNRHPLKELILHPRTGIQMYEGNADLERFAEFLSLSRHPVAYNGDILTREDYLERAKRFPAVRHWMLGRGALRNPFLALEIKGDAPPVAERRAILRRFHDEYYNVLEQRIGRNKQLLDVLKGLWSFLAWSLDEPEEFLTRLRRTKTVESYEELVRSVL